mmetsp:Transcript_26053/g.38551  ORF Transcript_26053/g.38551 Transcript_26053/m.38551 type:complete len:359 (-) Transcript_26053:297-1373(-)
MSGSSSNGDEKDAISNARNLEGLMKQMRDVSLKMGKPEKAKKYYEQWEMHKEMTQTLEKHDNSISEEESNSEEERDEMYYASAHDGLWLADGHDGMMMSLTEDDFLEEQDAYFLDDQRASNGELIHADEFAQFPPLEKLEDDQFWVSLRSKKLSVATYVVRRLSEGLCPPLIRIQRMEEDGVNEMLEFKAKGNQAFGSKDYEKAIEFYEDALNNMNIPRTMFIAPEDQMSLVVNILSNKAECELRLHRYNETCHSATDALSLDGGHEKSRIRRAKAELALGKQKGGGKSVVILVQANVDLEEVLRNDSGIGTDAGIKTAQTLLKAANRCLKTAKDSYLQKNPDTDWDLWVRQLRSTCW